jgi:creatinine amidohydrolase/Fe(II)-dependent formamide hydrolase-like protein/sterol desaturase/sphingolipid hydroxylase (fatty acid hydroxylase superfamily)
MEYLLKRLLDPALVPFQSTERLYWLYLAGALACTVCVFAASHARRRFSMRRLLLYCAPLRSWLHPSALLDYRYFVVNRVLFGLLVLPATTACGLAAAAAVEGGLHALAGAPAVMTPDTQAWSWLQALAAALAMDLGLFLAHRLQHSSALLWEFHKVHHSAQVLTPVTAYRMHPVDDLLSIALSSMLGGAVLGVFRHWQPEGPGPALVMGLNAVLFLYYLAGFNLRHSAVWLSYGRLLSHVLISPAQHQIHHSTAERHLGKNLGFVFALWDWLFGTLYVPEHAERLSFGLPSVPPHDYATVRRLYFLPFARALSIAKPRALLGLYASLVLALIVSLLTPRFALAQGASLFVEDLTWPEVRNAIAQGKTTAIYYCGSTEQNGPHMAIGKHNFVARYVARRIAESLGNALVYPIMPFAPTGDIAGRTGHMRFPGSVSVSEETFSAVAQSVAESAIAAGFREILLMGDHGGGQAALEQVAARLNRKWAGKGVKVRYIGELYFKTQRQVRNELVRMDKVPGTHAAIADTSELMSLDGAGRWIRQDKLARGDADNGIEGDSRDASAALGRRFLDMKVANALAQIRAQ